MDIFAVRDAVVRDYGAYVDSFLTMRDPRIRAFVQEQLDQGALWPDALLQFNPAYAPGPTLDELVARGELRPETARFFRRADDGPLRLYAHQYAALQRAQAGRSYVVTSGTGSGKSYTYLLPIYDALVRGDLSPGIRAILVYPMNALINSQYETWRQLAARTPGPVRADRYTGDVRGEERQRILDEQPHILLTNYVMLELLLTRGTEHHFISQATRHLQYLVFDELHTYRGRQGADVALLIRRLREASGNPALQCIGTSATMISDGPPVARRRTVAAVAAELFGVPITPDDVVEEQLQRRTEAPLPPDPAALRAAAAAPPPEDAAAFRTHPMAAWVETALGVTWDGERWQRRGPLPWGQAVQALAEASGLPPDAADGRLREWLVAGNRLEIAPGEPVLAFRLHQFLAGGGTVYATLEPPDRRHLTLSPQRYARGADGRIRPLFELWFCRECGQEYYAVDWNPATQAIAPWEGDELPPPDWQRGYLAWEVDELWHAGREEDLPDFWFEERGGSRRIKREYEAEVPQAIPWAAAELEAESPQPLGWFIRRPMLLCLRCGVAYDRRNKSDFRKLLRLSQTGRSTATTLTTLAALTALRAVDQANPPKLLSFTDSRQDAALQAGHFNDFVQTLQFRAAVVRAVREAGEPLPAHVLPERIVDAWPLGPEALGLGSGASGPGWRRARAALKRLVEYRLYEDLQRGWRVAQPNLEQCGLLRIAYDGLEAYCADPAPWHGHPLLARATPARRLQVITALLDHLRRDLALDAPILTKDAQDQLLREVEQNLPPAFQPADRGALALARVFVPRTADDDDGGRTRSLGPLSAVGRFLRRGATWGEAEGMAVAEYDALLDAVIAALRGHFLTEVPLPDGRRGYQVRTGALLWAPGDGAVPPPDPVRTRMLSGAALAQLERPANRFFQAWYLERAEALGALEGREHTGQVPGPLREEREARFREGRLPVLFCSPTMELGIDIRDLSVVHLRNVPPTPANYAQRSGRAGRGGQSALVVVFAGETSAHDRYFFDRPAAMVAGAVAPPALELAHPELLAAHLHAMWLRATGVDLHHSMAEVLDLQDLERLPLVPAIQVQSRLAPERLQALEASAVAVLGPLAAEAGLPATWIRDTLREAPVALDHAFDAWREQYRAALRQQAEANARVNTPGVGARERDEARRRREAAERQIELLLNQTGRAEADFYPYRYLAAQGFLPGYNFPRLPLQALVTVRGESHVLSRPRFLGLTEFGPHNTVYHEGSRFKIARVVVPPEGLQGRLDTARVCRRCGYWYPAGALVDRCRHCGTVLDGAGSEVLTPLLAMPTAIAVHTARITAEEEERLREGYLVQTYYRFADDADFRRATVRGPEGPMLELTYAPHAPLYRVNRKWRRAVTPGFALEADTGYWTGDAARGAATSPRGPVLSGVQPYVQDTRNLLLVRFVAPGLTVDEDLAYSFGYAVLRALQRQYHLEEDELAVEWIGEGDQRRLLFWENAEGGTGTWPRLWQQPDAWRRLAAAALAICHFDPATGADLATGPDACVRACYACLLGYANQPVHAHLDRHRIRDLLRHLMAAEQVAETGTRSYEEQYAWCRARVDAASGEAVVLEALYHGRFRLPDRVQVRPEPEVYAEADFYYERGGRPGVCVFVDGPAHADPDRRARDAAARAQLEDYGYRVIVLRYDEPWAAQFARYPDVFGRPLGKPSESSEPAP